MPRLVDNWADAPLPTTIPSAVAEQLASAPPEHRDTALWHGPQAGGALGGVTQSMLQGYLGCRERFRVKYVLGLKPMDRWERNSGYGNCWHEAEEALAANGDWVEAINKHADKMLSKYPMQREEICKWVNVCRVQFEEYVKYWASHPDVIARTPIWQEKVFDVLYQLPSGRVVRLRGKFDAVDLIG